MLLWSISVLRILVWIFSSIISSPRVAIVRLLALVSYWLVVVVTFACFVAARDIGIY